MAAPADSRGRGRRWLFGEGERHEYKIEGHSTYNARTCWLEGAEQRLKELSIKLPVTAPNSKAMTELIDGLAPTGKFMVVGISPDPIAVTPLQLISGERAVRGSAVGTPTDSEDTMNFAELTGVRPMVETYPLEKAAEAYARMMSGKAEFRVVLTM